MAQTPARAPVVYTTPPRPVTVRLHHGDGRKDVERVPGLLTFTITGANADESLAGTAILSLTEKERARLAQSLNRPLAEVPANLVKAQVTATVRAGAACPRLRLELGALEFTLLGRALDLERAWVEIIETPEQIPQLFCLWTRQRNAGRQRGGVLAAINRLLTGEQP